MKLFLVPIQYLNLMGFHVIKHFLSVYLLFVMPLYIDIMGQSST